MELETFNEIIEETITIQRGQFRRTKTSGGICGALGSATILHQKIGMPYVSDYIKTLFNNMMYPLYGNGRKRFSYWAHPISIQEFGHKYAHCRRLMIIKRFQQKVNDNPSLLENIGGTDLWT